MELETVQSSVAFAEYYKFHRFRMTICESYRVYSNLVICLLKIVNQTYAVFDVFVEAYMICCKSQACRIDHPRFRHQDLHWRRQRRDGAIILTDKRLIHVATLDPGYPEKEVLLVVRLEKASVH